MKSLRLSVGSLSDKILKDVPSYECMNLVLFFTSFSEVEEIKLSQNESMNTMVKV